MGLQISEIVPRKGIELSDLKGKTLAVDAFNTIYQFLSTIRQLDGTPLMDNKKRITSHLSGLFYRNINLLKDGLKLIYIFDGQMPLLKKRTHEKREAVKTAAFEKFQKAKKEGKVEDMGRYAKQLVRLDEEKIKESKKLLEAMGIQVVQAPGEGEAQAAYMARKKQIYAAASQDYDSLLFGAPLLIQNLTLARKRKTVTGYVSIGPELIELDRVLNSLQINLDQLISLGILCGTDYNPGGIYRIGPKKSLALVRARKAPALIFKQFPDLDFDWQEVFALFKKPDILKGVKVKFPKLQEEKVKKILLDHDFSEERIDSAPGKLEYAREQAKQKSLSSF